MGFYIQGPPLGKVGFIESEYGAEVLSGPPSSFDEVPENKGLICVVSNGPFEAAGFCFSASEFDAFTHPDTRPKTWLLMDLEEAKRASGFDL